MIVPGGSEFFARHNREQVRNLHGARDDLRPDGGKVMIRILLAPAALVFAASIVQAAEMTFYQLPAGSFPHDVAPAADGAVWFSGQRCSAASTWRPTSASAMPG